VTTAVPTTKCGAQMVLPSFAPIKCAMVCPTVKIIQTNPTALQPVTIAFLDFSFLE
jgi:hypothetical protein